MQLQVFHHKDAQKTVKKGTPRTKRSSTVTANARRHFQVVKSRRSQLTLLTETGARSTFTQGIFCPIGTFEIQLVTSSRKYRRLIAPAASRRLTIFRIIWTRFLGDLTRCHTSISCMLFLIYLTIELIIKCLWQHPAVSNHLEITKNEWSQKSNPIVLTTHSLRQLQTGNWNIANKSGTEELKNLF